MENLKENTETKQNNWIRILYQAYQEKYGGYNKEES